MIVRAKAPLRIGLAGGGTDVSPYSDKYGGFILNVTLDMFAYATIQTRDDDKICFSAQDIEQKYTQNIQDKLIVEDELILHKAIYKRVIQDFNGGKPIALDIITFSDAPPGSGLGSSSTMVVAILAAFRELLKLPLGEYDLAHLAYEIEREDCKLSGGKQDQYAATFGGFNFMEFYQDRVLVNPLRIRNDIQNELESQIILYFTGLSRDSGKIIDDQIKASTKTDSDKSLEALHKVKQSAFEMKECLLRNDIEGMSRVLEASWLAKKSTSSSISNSYIEEVASMAIENGAKSLKLSGAGGGGFMMLFVDPVDKQPLIKKLKQTSGQVHNFQFTNFGVKAWTVHNI
ncbi:dehydrogenase [Alteromonas portus]|uniref:Dehydrogenase n=1 Tax=Alteromonas portus TaxID=2565549 RepID=A0A4U0ZMQ5_9ALTE|nr:dehydrogenase [Alteromonas portus]TKB03482.1 dehydrogenase [Alteromonas portus]